MVVNGPIEETHWSCHVKLLAVGLLVVRVNHPKYFDVGNTYVPEGQGIDKPRLVRRVHV